MIHDIIGLDFETYSAASLPDVGLANYVADDTFIVTLAAVASQQGTTVIDFVHDPSPVEKLSVALDMSGEYITPYQLRHGAADGLMLSAHNAGFETAVLRRIGLEYPVLDSAVVASVAGANRHLANAARQLLDEDKLDEDRSLIRLFAIPQKDQATPEFDSTLCRDNPGKWQLYKEYCARDAQLSRNIMKYWQPPESIFSREMYYAYVTQVMNETGWPVDIPAVLEMKSRHDMNLDDILDEFQRDYDRELNLNSNPQLVKWCRDRGVNARSFDRTHVAKMITKLEARPDLTPGQKEVLAMLRAKRALGGSSLSKLSTIVSTSHNGRLYDQYMHAGAAQSLRTSGRGVQMQNLKRLSHMRDMDELYTGRHWSNKELEGNLRQVFRAEHRHGQIVVADYSAAESRGLAWLAGEDWKTQAYRRGDPIYEELAAKKFGIATNQVSKEQRTFGKVGELSCGYGAGPVAVKDFAEKMGVILTEDEAKELVWGWRDACPKTVMFWEKLNQMLHSVLISGNRVSHSSTSEFWLTMEQGATPASLLAMNPAAQTIHLNLWGPQGLVLQRIFHGCHRWDTDICYYKPSSLKTGSPWQRSVYLEKEKKTVRYKLYGGKLAGILTQSLCREIFFAALARIHDGVENIPNVKLIGQFHDEVVLEWEPGDYDLDMLINDVQASMITESVIPGLPLAAEVKHARTYIK